VAVGVRAASFHALDLGKRKTNEGEGLKIAGGLKSDE
jgi:hypothetical protein